jgi:integrase
MTALVEKRCACAEARWPKCDHPWYLKQIRWGGKTFEPNLTRHVRQVLARKEPLEDKVDAERIARDVINAIQLGTYVRAKHHRPPPPPKTTQPGQTLDVVAEAFARICIDKDAEKADNSKANDRAHLKRLCRTEVDGDRLGARVMADITLEDLIEFRAEQEELSASTWNKIRTVLGQLWSWARWHDHITRDLLTDSPPAMLKKVGRSQTAQRRERFLGNLWDDILEAATELRVDGARFVGLLTTLMETGARVGELLALQWKDVHFDTKTLHIRGVEVGAGKTGERKIEISEVLVPVLLDRQLDPAGKKFKLTAYVFGDAYGDRLTSVKKAWATTLLRASRIEPRWTEKGDYDAATRAQLRDINKHIHDIRHEAACRWLESGLWNLDQIRIRLGHTTIAQTATYLHVEAGSARTAQQAYDAKRQADAEAAAAAAATLTKAVGENAGKLQANSKNKFRPRLIKSDNT